VSLYITEQVSPKKSTGTSNGRRAILVNSRAMQLPKDMECKGMVSLKLVTQTAATDDRPRRPGEGGVEKRNGRG